MRPILPTFLPSDFVEVTGRPEKFCTLHYANLIWVMNLTEVMVHAETAGTTLTAVTEFVIETGMVQIPVLKEQNGYVLNTWLVPLFNAAQTRVTNGVSTPENVDRTYMIANRPCVRGPMGLVDVVGMKTCHDILAYWGSANNDTQMLANADYIKSNLLDHGKLGLQTGEGYYRYPNPAFENDDFLAVTSIEKAPELVKQIRQGG